MKVLIAVDGSAASLDAVAPASVTENGVADLRGKTPNERAHIIIKKCAHPQFHDALLHYAELAKQGQTPQTLSRAFAFHEQFLRTGDMRDAVLA